MQFSYRQPKVDYHQMLRCVRKQESIFCNQLNIADFMLAISQLLFCPIGRNLCLCYLYFTTWKILAFLFCATNKSSRIPMLIVESHSPTCPFSIIAALLLPLYYLTDPKPQINCIIVVRPKYRVGHGKYSIDWCFGHCSL